LKAPLCSQVLLESDCLFRGKGLRVAISGVDLEPIEGLRGGIHGGLAVTFGLLKIGKIFALDSFVMGAVFTYGLISLSKSLFTVGWVLLLT
jgi:hypothetical protein